MKKNISINLFGTLYAIDEDAYNLLENYLNSMKSYFSRQQGGEEIADDIEHRVAEILWQKKEEGAEAVNIDMVREIITQIGDPAQIDNESKDNSEAANTADDNDFNASSQETPDSHPFADGGSGRTHSNGTYSSGANADSDNPAGSAFDRIKQRRLYRINEGKMLGGVCTGLAQYLDLDVTLVRLAVCVLAIFGWWFDVPFIGHLVNWVVPIGYFVLCFIIPVAHTPEDKLRMSGRDVNPQNINEQILHDSNAASQQASQAYSAPRQDNNGCLKLGIGGCLLIILAPLFLGLIATLLFAPIMGGLTSSGLFTSVFSPFGNDPDSNFFLTLINTMQSTLWAVIFCLIMVLIIPIYLIIRWMRNSEKPLSSTAIVSLIIVWLLALGFGLFFIFRGIGEIGKDAVNYSFHIPGFTYRYSVTHGEQLLDSVDVMEYEEEAWERGSYEAGGTFYDDEDEYHWMQDNNWTVKNAKYCSRFTYSGEWMTGDENVRYLDCNNDWHQMGYTVEKSQVIDQPGKYRLTVATRSQRSGAYIFVKVGCSIYDQATINPYMARTSINSVGNTHGSAWRWAKGELTAEEANIPAHMKGHKSLIADANFGEGYGWGYQTVEDIIVPKACKVYYGVTTDKKITESSDNCEWFSATDFMLERTGDL